MSRPEVREPLDLALESLKYIEYILKDYPDRRTQFPEEQRLNDLIIIKDIAKKTVKKINERAA